MTSSPRRLFQDPSHPTDTPLRSARPPLEAKPRVVPSELAPAWRFPTESSTVLVHTKSADVAATPSSPRNATPGRRPAGMLPTWGATGVRSSLLKRLKPPVAAKEESDLNNDAATPELIEARTELQRLLQAIHDALTRRDHRRCLLILTYLLHARHLIHPEVLNFRRCGETVTALTYSSDTKVAQCAKTLRQLWRYGLMQQRKKRG